MADINFIKQIELVSLLAEQRWTEGRKMDNRWIPVTERLPELEEDVFVICRTSTGSVYHCIAFYVPEETTEFESGYCWDYECTHYSEEKDEYYVDEGWYESIHNLDDYRSVPICDIVTHWMPLPEPPKEDEQ